MRTEQEIQKRIEHLEHEVEAMKSTGRDHAGYRINWGPHIDRNMQRIEVLKWVLTSREDDLAAAEQLRQLMHDTDAANGKPWEELQGDPANDMGGAVDRIRKWLDIPDREGSSD